jgi:hypothetical protein
MPKITLDYDLNIAYCQSQNIPQVEICSFINNELRSGGWYSNQYNNWLINDISVDDALNQVRTLTETVESKFDNGVKGVWKECRVQEIISTVVLRN